MLDDRAREISIFIDIMTGRTVTAVPFVKEYAAFPGSDVR